MVDEDAELLLAQQLTLRKTVEEKIDTPRPKSDDIALSSQGC
jgi:hypothetical protein